MYAIVYNAGTKIADVERGDLAAIMAEVEYPDTTWTYAGRQGSEVKYTAKGPGMSGVVMYVRPHREHGRPA